MGYSASVAFSALLAATALSGCSLVGVRGPAGTSATARPCTTSYALPVIDGVFAAAGFVGGGYALLRTLTDDTRSSPEALGAIMVGVPAAALGVAYLTSALVGRARVGRCREPVIPTPEPDLP